MKKSLLSLLVAAICLPASAGIAKNTATVPAPLNEKGINEASLANAPQRENAAVVTLPDGVTPEEYIFTAKSLSWDDSGSEQYEDVSRSMMVARDANDVYLQGFSTNIPEAWVKGTLDGNNNAVFPAGQYLGQKDYSIFGVYDFWFNGYDNNTRQLKDAVFAYDGEKDEFTTDDWIRITTAQNSVESYAIYVNSTIAKVKEMPGTPQTPTILSYDDDEGIIWIELDVPIIDTEGNGLSTDKLFYKFYTDIEGDINPFVFVGGEYESIEEDTEEIPYNLDDNTEFLRGGEIVILYAYDSDEWNRIGIQSIYRGGGEEHASEINWYNIKPTAISAVKAGQTGQGATYDLQGRKVGDNPAPGIYIRDGKKFIAR